ncbi:MAG: hypothetical protein KDJ25_09865 [Rhodoblastus sp.]|nr:hypothetical protein [Rhodoblastus sp.]
MSDTPDTLAASLVTCSFRGDLDVCRLLCETVDRFASSDMVHWLYVPRADLSLFADLASPRRRIATQESLLPWWFRKAPMPGPEWRARLGLPRRNVYVTPFSLPVRGWIAQQIMKISAAAGADTEIVVHVDSDNAFIRPLRMEHLARDRRVRLYRHPEMVARSSHRMWHEAAGRLLGLAASDFHGAEYIDQLVVWRRSVARGLTEHIAEIAKTDWRIALARAPHFAEYILYGVYADRVLGLDKAGLFATEQTLCLSRWTEGFDSADEETAFVAAIEAHHIACLVQSTIAMPIAARHALFERASAFAAQQDAGVTPES